MDSLGELLEISDYVTMHVTEGELRRMKKGAVFINNSGGSVVDLDAHAKVLKEGHLAGAAIAVFSKSRNRTTSVL